jgi:hypothetical protein
MLSPRQSAACAVAACLIVVGWLTCRGPAAGPTPDHLPGVLSRLRQRGVALHLYTPEGAHGEVGHALYLTAEPREIADLKALPRAPDRLARWQGAAFAEELAEPAQQGLEGPGALHYGRVLFFGDPELLARIRAALAE